MATMLQSTTMTLPEAAQAETEQLRAEIHRMADMVSGVVRNTAIDAISAAMTVAAGGASTAPQDATQVAGEVLRRASVMQTEIDRFLSIAAGRSAA
jgi:hypothetical protein